MAMPALNPWDQLTPAQQASLVQKIQAGLPQTGGAAPAASPLEQRMGGQPMPPGWPGAGTPLQALPKNPNLQYLDDPAGQLAAPMAQRQAAQAFPPPAGAANAGLPDGAPTAGLPLHLPQQTVQQRRAAASAGLQVPYAPGHGPWDMGQDPHATTSPGGGKNPRDYQGQVDAGNPNGGMPPSAGAPRTAPATPGAARGRLADIFGVPGMGMMNPRSMFKPGEMAPNGSGPQNPLQAAGSPQSTLPGSPQSLGQMGQNPAAISAGQKGILGNTMAEFQDRNYLQPIDPMTMKGEKSEGTAAQKTDVSTQQTAAVPEGAFGTALARVIQGTPGMQMMRGDLTNLRGSLGDIIKREGAAGPGSRVDLSPAMALSDTWFGGDLSKGYHPPLKRLEMVANLAKTLTGGEGQLTDSEVNFLRSQLQDKYMSDLATNLGGSRQVSVGAGMGAGMMNPLEFLRFGAEQQQRAIQHDREASQDAGKFAGEGGTQYAEIQKALEGIDKIARNNHAYQQNYLPGYGGHVPLIGGLIQNFHNPSNIGLSEEGKDLNRYLAVLSNAANHADFGDRITNSEMQAQARNLATAQGQGPRQALKAISDYQAALRRALTAKRGSMTDQARAKAKQSGALMPEDFNFTFGINEPPPKAQPRGQTKTGQDQPPSVDDLHRQVKERAKALSGGK